MVTHHLYVMAFDGHLIVFFISLFPSLHFLKVLTSPFYSYNQVFGPLFRGSCEWQSRTFTISFSTVMMDARQPRAQWVEHRHRLLGPHARSKRYLYPFSCTMRLPFWDETNSAERLTWHLRVGANYILTYGITVAQRREVCYWFGRTMVLEQWACYTVSGFHILCS